MNSKNRTKIIHEGNYVAEVEVELIDSENSWAPYLKVEDAYRLDDMRIALRQHDIATAVKIGKVYTLTPVAV